MDETSARKGRGYIGIFADLDARRVMFATEGRCAETVGRFAADLAAHAIDTVRRAEVATRPELEHTHRLWLKNRANLSTLGRKTEPCRPRSRRMISSGRP